MHFSTVLRILGILLVIFSATHLSPLLVSLIYDDGNTLPFIISFSVTFITGLILWACTRRSRSDLRYRDGFLVVVLFWTVLASFGSLPFVISEAMPLSVTDAFFESMSGLTTTGGTIFTQLEVLPKSLLYYRQQQLCQCLALEGCNCIEPKLRAR